MGRILTLLIMPLLLACSDDGGFAVRGNPPSGTVRGVVNDISSAPVLGATVVLSGSGISSRNTTTNTLGVYVFNTVPVGSYLISITAPPGYSVSGPGTSTVTVTANRQSNVNPFILNRTTGDRANAIPATSGIATSH